MKIYEKMWKNLIEKLAALAHVRSYRHKFILSNKLANFNIYLDLSFNSNEWMALFENK